VVKTARLIIGADVHVVEIDLLLFYHGITVFQISPSQPERFDLSPHQRNSYLEAFQNMIKMMSPAVGRNYLNLLFVLLHATKYIIAVTLWQVNFQLFIDETGLSRFLRQAPFGFELKPKGKIEPLAGPKSS
jgi:hypothetical protein